MKLRLPTEFVFEDEDVKVVYLKGSDAPYYNATHIARALGRQNPSGSAASMVTTLSGRVEEYCKLNNKEFVTDVFVEVANSTKKAVIVASDGVVTILSIKRGNNPTSKPTYYYSQDALYEVLLSSGGEVATRFRYWITHEVLPAIARTGEYIQHRKDGIGLRRGLTDAIKLAITNNVMNEKAYMGITDAVYYIRFGLHTQTLREYLKLKDGENIREHLNQEDLDALAKLEADITGCINFGVPLDKILASERWVKLYRRNLI